jgi:hypothetical protein
MGKISNLITDMTLKGANNQELARAVRHSMVVIDAEKHKLNWKQSELDNGIKQLSLKYQDRAGGGSSTLISRASSPLYINDRKPRSFAKGGPIDPATGKKVYEDKPSYINKAGKEVNSKIKVDKLAYYEDAHRLSSGTPIEQVYGDYSNRMKALANQARKESLSVKPAVWSESAKKTYASEVTSLNNKLEIALRNAPLERQAQVLANAIIAAKRDANPNMDAADLKKEKFLALDEARRRTNAGKKRIEITDREWEAIQAGAISNSKLSRILDNADMKTVKVLATPRTTVLMTSTKVQRAQALMASGHTQAEVAELLGVSLTTLKNGLKL